MPINKLSIIIGVTALLLSACQSKSYKIEGAADGMADGDTLFLCTDPFHPIPFDTIVIKDGRFVTHGQTDSTFFCQIFSAKDHETGIDFFIEPGTIQILLSNVPTKCKVGGTPINKEWQRMIDSVTIIGSKIQQIGQYLYNNKLNESERQEMQAKQEEQFNKFKSCVRSYAEKNIDNELGYFILTYFDEDIIEPKVREELISNLSPSVQNRPQIQAMMKYLKELEESEEGKSIGDFTMNGLDGKPLSIMALVSKNRFTILDFWASWCGPCRASMPQMVALYHQYKDKGLGMIGISLDTSKEDWERTTKQLGIEWPQMSDLRGWENTAARLFNVQAIPYTIVVDQQGIIVAKGLHTDKLEEFISSKLQ